MFMVFNPWWEDSFKAEGIRREDCLHHLDGKKRIKEDVINTGLRRAWKTTLIQQHVERLTEGGKDPGRTLCFSIDHPGPVREAILEIFDERRGIQGLRQTDRFTIIIDEVHLREGFEQRIKTVDGLGNVSVFATGSSSLFMVEGEPSLTSRQTFVEVFLFSRHAIEL